MTIEEIEKFLSSAKTENEAVRISFKKRDPMNGLFIKDRDYADLKSKNFWRIVPQSQLELYSQSKNVNLAKIFSGSDFAKLAVQKPTAV
jgi:hypothetical protein